jgi:hypothetical protein
MKKSITVNQLSALKKYADHEGRKWKKHLAGDWMDGFLTARLFMSRDEQSLLQQLRNSHGPTWLKAFKF